MISDDCKFGISGLLFRLLFCVLICFGSTRAYAYYKHSDSWAATDSLGRELVDYDEAGGEREGKLVGLFYYIWHGAHGDKVYDIARILKDNPEEPAWGPVSSFHYWGEPEYGYYRSDDPWVIRHDLQLFAVAGIDFIFFDVTNAFTYLDTVKAVCQVSVDMRKDGIDTPEICFLTNSYSGRVVNQLYDEFYSKELFAELWFKWDGKPLIMANADDAELRPEMKEFFTIRYSWAWTDSKGKPGHWQWLDTYPQDWGWADSRDVPEQITVSTAQHPTSTQGKSFKDGEEPSVSVYYETDRTDEGLQFAQQWQRALEVDPQVVMVTQWNEWVAQRFIWENGDGVYAGRPIAKGDSFFVDVFSKEFNRDIAPMAGGYTDNYYYQLVDYVRRFKGVARPQSASRSYEISVDGKFGDWQTVVPVFYDPPGDTMHRDHIGYDPTQRFVNATGRNDIVEARVACDDDIVYFYAKTRADITLSNEKNWMLLFIDIDQQKETGWEGYDIVANLEIKGSFVTSLHKIKDVKWEPEFLADISYGVKGCEVEIAVPKILLGIAGGADFVLDFHWADNIQKYGEITEFFLNGESAPDRRFNYRYHFTE